MTEDRIDTHFVWLVTRNESNCISYWWLSVHDGKVIGGGQDSEYDSIIESDKKRMIKMVIENARLILKELGVTLPITYLTTSSSPLTKEQFGTFKNNLITG